MAKVTPKRTTYTIANYHTANIVFPRAGRIGLKVSPLILPPGKSIEVSAEEWNVYRKNKGVQNYIDVGLIAEVDKVGNVPMTEKTSVELEIPEHLKRDEEVVNNKPEVKAAVVKKSKSTIII